MITMSKVRQYFKDQGLDPESAVDHVTLIFNPESNATSVLSWDTDIVARPSDAYWDTAPDYNPTPFEVTARQFRLALIDDGVTMAQVDAAILTLPDDGTREKAQIEWEYAGGIQRTNPLVLSLAPALGFDTDEKIDNLFRAAGAI